MTCKSAISGQPVEPSDKIVFTDWRRLCTVLTAERYDLLRALARGEAADLAVVVGRDPRSIEADFAALVDIALVLRNEAGVLSTAVDEIASTIRIAA